MSVTDEQNRRELNEIAQINNDKTKLFWIIGAIAFGVLYLSMLIVKCLCKSEGSSRVAVSPTRGDNKARG